MYASSHDLSVNKAQARIAQSPVIKFLGFLFKYLYIDFTSQDNCKVNVRSVKARKSLFFVCILVIRATCYDGSAPILKDPVSILTNPVDARMMRMTANILRNMSTSRAFEFVRIFAIASHISVPLSHPI